MVSKEYELLEWAWVAPEGGSIPRVRFCATGYGKPDAMYSLASKRNRDVGNSPRAGNAGPRPQARHPIRCDQRKQRKIKLEPGQAVH